MTQPGRKECSKAGFDMVGGEVRPATISREDTETARRIQELREEHRTLVTQKLPGSTVGLVLLDHLFRQPVVTVARAREVIGRTYPVANQVVADFEGLGLLREITGHARNRVFRYEPYLQLFGELRP